LCCNYVLLMLHVSGTHRCSPLVYLHLKRSIFLQLKLYTWGPCLATTFIFGLFFLYVLSVYALCGPKIGLIKSYLILSYPMASKFPCNFHFFLGAYKSNISVISETYIKQNTHLNTNVPNNLSYICTICTNVKEIK
jgi:hypothetical protein